MDRWRRRSLWACSFLSLRERRDCSQASAPRLGLLGTKVRRKPVLYWLDAHWCGDEGEHSGGVEEQCPLLDELNAIRSINNRSVVLVDDARLFMAPPPAPATTEGWPQLSQVLERLTALNSKHELLVIDDVFVFFPPAAREVLSEFAR